MKCKKCGESMRVTHTDRWERLTIRYLKCLRCGHTDQSIEQLRPEKAIKTPDMESTPA